MQITVILTCFNRKESTCTCIRSLEQGNRSLELEFIVVDDASRDGTKAALEAMADQGSRIHIIEGDGNLYWAGGMRMGIQYAKEHTDTEYYLLVNDDVEFSEHSIERMLEQIEPSSVMVGPVCDAGGAMSYGGIRYTGEGVHYGIIGPGDEHRECDTFNANCVLMPGDIFRKAPNIDTVYKHSLGDFDYGLCLKRMGIILRVSDFYAGICSENPLEQTWRDTSLSRKERILRKEQIKGAPWKPWFYFLRKNFGLKKAVVHSLTPYVRILLGR